MWARRARGEIEDPVDLDHDLGEKGCGGAGAALLLLPLLGWTRRWA